MELLNKIKWNDLLLLKVDKGEKNKNIFIFENNVKLTSKEINRKTKILIQCKITKKWIERVYSEQFLYKKEYTSPSASVSGEKNGMYGKTHSDENKRKISERTKGNKYRLGKKFTPKQKAYRSKLFSGSGNSFYGKYHTEESKQKIRESIPDYTGENNPFHGKRHSKETILKIKEKGDIWRKNNYEKFIESCKIGAYNSMYSQKRFKKKSKCEEKFEQELINRNIDYQYSVILNGKQFDFLINDEILIEVHGDYWHGNPKFYGDELKPLNDIQLNKQQKDKEKYQWCIDNKYKIYYIWENEINNQDFHILKEII